MADLDADRAAAVAAGLGRHDGDPRARAAPARPPRCAGPTSSAASRAGEHARAADEHGLQRGRARAEARPRARRSSGTALSANLRGSSPRVPAAAGSTTWASPATPRAAVEQREADARAQAERRRARRRATAETASSPMRTMVSRHRYQAEAREQLLDAAGVGTSRNDDRAVLALDDAGSESSSSATSLAPARLGEHGLRRSRRACRSRSRGGVGSISRPVIAPSALM